jgi:hypothetical protein
MRGNWLILGGSSDYLRLGLIAATAIFGFLGLIRRKDQSRREQILLLVGLLITFVLSAAISISDIRSGQIAAEKHDAELRRILLPISHPSAEVTFRLDLDSREDPVYVSHMLNAFRQLVKHDKERESQIDRNVTVDWTHEIGGFGEKTPLRHLLPRDRLIPRDFNDTNDLDLYFIRETDGMSCNTWSTVGVDPDLVLLSEPESGGASIDLDPTVSWAYSTTPQGESITLRRTISLRTEYTNGAITSVEDIRGSMLLVLPAWPREFKIESLTIRPAEGVRASLSNFKTARLTNGSDAPCFAFRGEGVFF